GFGDRDVNGEDGRVGHAVEAEDCSVEVGYSDHHSGAGAQREADLRARAVGGVDGIGDDGRYIGRAQRLARGRAGEPAFGRGGTVDGGHAWEKKRESARRRSRINKWEPKAVNVHSARVGQPRLVFSIPNSAPAGWLGMPSGKFGREMNRTVRDESGVPKLLRNAPVRASESAFSTSASEPELRKTASGLPGRSTTTTVAVG